MNISQGKCRFPRDTSVENSTPENDLNWLRNLGRVSNRSDVKHSPSVGKSPSTSSSSRFRKKSSFRRRSIECDLHPSALIRRSGIASQNLSPLISVKKRPYGGYFTRDSLAPLHQFSNGISTPYEITQSTSRNSSSLYQSDKKIKIDGPLAESSKPCKFDERNPPSLNVITKSGVSDVSYKVESPLIHFTDDCCNENVFQFKGGGDELKSTTSMIKNGAQTTGRFGMKVQ